MDKKIKARIDWILEKDGGRTTLPLGPRYVTVARFDDEKEKYPAEAWSLVLEFEGPPDHSNSLVADVRFLVEDAPVYLLHKGSMFELYEGRKLVARGQIL